MGRLRAFKVSSPHRADHRDGVDGLLHVRHQRVQVLGTGHERVHPVGQWNIHEVACQGKSITAWLNVAEVTTWKDCSLTEGHIGLQAEFFTVEFRNLKFKKTNK